MKLTNGEIFTARAPLETLIGMKFPVGVSFKLARMVTALNNELTAIDTVRKGLVTKYGEQDVTGQVSVKPEHPNYAKFVEEFNNLMAEEVEVVITKVKLPEEVDGKPLEVEPSLLMALDKFVEV